MREAVLSEQGGAPYFQALSDYVKSGVSPWHIPGHLAGRTAPKELSALFREHGLACDITEVLGLDDIHHPHHQVMEAQKLAAEAFGAEATRFLVQGSTVGNHAMLLSTLSPGDWVLAPENCHRSFFAGAVLSGIRVKFFPTSYDRELLCSLPPSADEVRDAIDECPQAKALFLTSVTYQGACAQVTEIVKMAQDRGLLVLVDEAWGAHFPFHADLPESALKAGADMVVHSLHKSTGGLTPTALLHFRPSRVDEERVRLALGHLQTSSPSSLLVASIDCTRRKLALEGEEPWSRLLERSQWLQSRANEVEGVRCFPKIPPNWDPARLTVDASSLGYSGYDLNQALRERFSLQCEMAELKGVLVALTPGHNNRDVDRLVGALFRLEPRERSEDFRRLVELSRAHLDFRLRGPRADFVDPRQAFYARRSRVGLKDAIDRRSSELIYCYPPGVPLVFPGEPFSKATIELLETQIALGGSVQGGVDPQRMSVLVLEDD